MQQPTNSKILIILNPVAGNTDGRIVKKEIVKNFGQYNIDYKLYATTGKEVLTDVVKNELKKHSYKIVVAAGGDGTISETAEALVEGKTPLGIIPLGSANCLAQELNIPFDIAKACKLICKRHAFKRIDAMKVGDKYYFLDISVGAKALTIKDTDRETKQKFGLFAYIIKGFKRVFTFRPKRFVIEVDGRVIEKRASEVVIANGSIIGQKLFRYGSHIHIDDGILNVCVIHGRNLFEYIKIVFKFLLPQKHSDRHIKYWKVKKQVKITSKRPLPVQGDGEIIGKTPIEVENVAGVVNVVVPKE